MSKSALLDLVPLHRRKVIWHTEDGKQFIETKQDVSGVIKAAGVLSQEKPDKDFTRVALIPLEVLNQAILDGWADDQEQWKKWANDPANRRFRTTEGTI